MTLATQILEKNLPCLLELQLCSTFNPDLQVWCGVVWCGVVWCED